MVYIAEIIERALRVEKVKLILKIVIYIYINKIIGIIFHGNINLRARFII